MATWTRRETTIRRIEHVLPVPAASAALCQAYTAAELHYRRNHAGIGLPVSPNEDLPDNALTITVTDDAIVIAYDIDTDELNQASAAQRTQDSR